MVNLFPELFRTVQSRLLCTVGLYPTSNVQLDQLVTAANLKWPTFKFKTRPSYFELRSGFKFKIKMN